MKPRDWIPASVAAALAGCGGGDGSPSQVPEPPACSERVSAPRVFENLTFDAPVAMKQAPDDPSRWFVVEQGGLVRAFENDPAADSTQVFVDLRTRVHMEGEAGLLGLAFHPGFVTNGRVYLNFTVSTAGLIRSVTAEFTSTDGGQTLDPGSERVLLSVVKPATNHNGGNLEFGPDDGLLYVGLGDGGGSGDPDGNAQNTARLLGKMLRIDVDAQPGGLPYGIPGGIAGNPFVGNALCNLDGTGAVACPEIFALGFRNPWRWSFDRQTDELWLGDVGQASFEEIDIVEVGNNYGWNLREGANCFLSPNCSTAGLTDPVAEYGRDLGFSITGGFVYRGGQATSHAGRYVFADFGGMIASLAPDGAGGFTIDPLVEQGCTPPDAPGALQVSSFAEDLDGELYVLDYGRGHVRQLVFED